MISIRSLSRSFRAVLCSFLFLSITGLSHVQAQTAIRGTVSETTNTTTYTYARVTTPDGEVWLAGPRVPVKVGDAISTPPGMLMKDFNSPSMKRVFKEIYFVGAIKVDGGAQEPAAQALPPGHPTLPATLPPGHPQIPGAGAPPATPAMLHAGVQQTDAPDIPEGKIEPLATGLTIEQIYAQSAQWKDQVVRVRGEVVKVNRKVLGMNWIHLRDGTGKEGTNDLTLNSSQDVQVGDTVIAKGKLGVDEDFGSGYLYPVLLKRAEITVEKKAD